jgi:hypothetical protein
MESKRYRITCLKCKKSSLINIVDGQDVVYVDHTPIIACRLRGDLKWGFECMCGNDSRLCVEEKKDANILIQGSSEGIIKKVVDSLKIKDELKFRMESA